MIVAVRTVDQGPLVLAVSAIKYRIFRNSPSPGDMLTAERLSKRKWLQHAMMWLLYGRAPMRRLTLSGLWRPAELNPDFKVDRGVSKF